MKTLRAILLVTGLLVAGIAFKATFGNRALQQSSGNLLYGYTQPGH